MTQYQFNFRSKVATRDGLVYCTESFRKKIDRNKYVALALLDLSGALILPSKLFWRSNHLIKPDGDGPSKILLIDFTSNRIQNLRDKNTILKILIYFRVCFKVQSLCHFSLIFILMISGKTFCPIVQIYKIRITLCFTRSTKFSTKHALILEKKLTDILDDSRKQKLVKKIR